MQLSDLKGQTLLSVRLDGGCLFIETDALTAKIEAVGDCCSTGWIDGLAAPTLPAQIVKGPDCYDYSGEQREVEKGEPGYPEEDGDVVVVYPAEIRTVAGVVGFNVWNDSNGYYGSSLELVDVKMKDSPHAS